jgi:hypothetical protein
MWCGEVEPPDRFWIAGRVIRCEEPRTVARPVYAPPLIPARVHGDVREVGRQGGWNGHLA